MHAFDPDDGADWTGLLHGDVLNFAEVAFAAWGIFRVVSRAALQDADELTCAGDGLAAEGDGVDEVGTGEWDGALQCSDFDASMNQDRLAGVLDGESLRSSRGPPSN